MDQARNAAPKLVPKSEGTPKAPESPLPRAAQTFFVELPLKMTNEILHFASRRMTEQAKLLSALTSCKTMGELAEAHSAFVKSAFEDYSKEAGAIMDRVNEAAA